MKINIYIILVLLIYIKSYLIFAAIINYQNLLKIIYLPNNFSSPKTKALGFN